MNETSAAPATPKKRRSLLRILLGLTGVGAVLVVLTYFVITSSSFLKGTILPRVSKSLNAEITVSDASIKPFSSVTLRNLKVTPIGRETLLIAPEVRARYGLLDILRGNILVEEISITSPTIHLVEQPDGSSNLDPILQSQPDSDASDTDSGDESSEPPRLDIRKLSLTGATIRQEKIHDAQHRDLTELSGINVLLTNLKNGDSGRLTVSANAAISNNPPAPGTNGALQATLGGEYVFALSSDLKPLSVKGESQLKVVKAEGAFADLATLTAILSADVAPSDIKTVSLRFQKAGEALGELRASGPFNLETAEGRLQVEMLSLDRRVLNLAGAASGLDFGTTSISSTNELQMANAGKTITVVGRLNADQLQLIRTNQSTPTVNFHANYDLQLDMMKSNAVLRALTLNGTQDGRRLIRGELSSPMSLPMGGTDGGIGDSAFNLTVENIHLAEWKPFIGDAFSQGNVNLTLTLRSEQGGKQLHLNLHSELADIAPVGGDKKLTSAALNANLGVLLGALEQTTVKGSMEVSNVVIMDPTGSIPRTPLSAGLNLDATMSTNVLDLRQLQVILSPTQRARNELLLQGRIDSSNTNALQGSLKLTADALDLTSYYDLFAGGTDSQTSPTIAAGKVPTNAPQETATSPALTNLPFRDFVADAQINRLYLREIEITNLQTTIRLNGGQALLNPMRMALNGAPVNASVDLDLSVPGYQYDLAFEAVHVPFAPLVNTFEPARKGELGGTLSAFAKINGTGTTGESLQKTLTGNFDVGTTNLNLSAANIRQPMLKLLVSVVAMVPQLAQNPEAALGSLVSGLSGSLTQGRLGATTGDFANSPIDVISFRGVAGNGKIDLQQATVRSTIFQADAAGVITLAPILTNSTIQIPVSISLVRPLAERIKMVPADADPAAAYVRLPDFFAETGTLGDPKARIDKKVLAGSVLNQVGGLIPGASDTNSTVGAVIQGLGGLLGRPKAATNVSPPGPIPAPATATNQPAATNSSPLSDVLKILGPKTK